jgi:hypothetical protein
MSILAAAAASCITALEGLLLIRLLEGRAPVLYRFERWALGLLLGSAGSAYILFWCAVFGMPLRLLWFFSVHLVLIGALLFLVHRSFPYFALPQSPKADISFTSLKRTLPFWAQCLIAWFIVWTLLKIAAGAYDLMWTPAYWNDVYANWHMRTKAFFFNESLLLDLPQSDEFFFGGRVPGYPLTVYFAKLFAVMIRGEWLEAALNGVNVFWFLSLLTLFFCGLLRVTNLLWSIVGTWILVSLPLLLVHGSSGYSDVFMAAYLFFALCAFYQWMQSSGLEKNTWMRLFTATSAAMVFVKNEALLIFLPPILLLFVFVLGTTLSDSRKRAGLFFRYVGAIAVVAVPWSFFKFFHGLTFGNASKVSGFSLSPNPYVLKSIQMDLMYTGSYLLLFPLFLLLLAITWHFWRRSALTFLIAFIAVVFVGEIGIYWLTPLAEEAIRHTGFGRGMVHLLPLVVFVSVLLLKDLFGEKPFGAIKAASG